MKRIGRHLRTVVAIAVVGMLAAVVIPQPKPLQASGTAPVTVMNTPLPVSLTGTGNVSGTVNVASLPAVQLASGTTVGISGGFTNTENTPLFISDVAEPAKHAFVVKLCASNIGCDVPSAATVPVGTRYVIEQASGDCLVIGEGIKGWQLTAQLNGEDNVYLFRDEISTADTSTSARGLFFQQTRIYADLVSVQLFASGGGGNGATCEVTLSGHLVSMPQPPFPTASLAPSNVGTVAAR